MKRITLLIYLTFLFPVGEAGAIFLLIAPGASAAGTGEAQVAKADDAYASYYNPAGLGFQNRSGMAGMHVNWLPNLADDLYYEFLAYKQPLEGMDGTIGGHLIYLNLGEQMGMDEMGNETGQFKSYMWAFALSYGTKISKTSSVGINFKVFHQKLADSGTGSEGGDPYSTDFAFDLGYLKKFNKGLNLGISILNIGPPIDFVDADQADPSPTNLKFGIQKEFIIDDYNKINILLDVNRLMVARYPAMDWNNDGKIQDDGIEPGYTDPWWKAIVTCWLDDWYYKYDRDYDGDDYIGGFEDVIGEYKAFSLLNADGSYEHDAENNSDDYNGYNGEIYYESLDLYGLDVNPGCVENDYGYCNQYAHGGSLNYYHNGYNLTSIDFLDDPDSFEDLNSNDYWDPGEPFYDVGTNTQGIDLNYNGGWDPGEPIMDGDIVLFNPLTLDLDEYQYIDLNEQTQTAWIYYDAEGSIAEISYVEDGDNKTITSMSIGNGEWDFLDNDGDGICDSEDPVDCEEYVDWNGNGTRDESEPWTDDNNNGTFDTGYSSKNGKGEKEVGSGDDYSFEDELKELISNFGIEYWYTDNFVLRAGYIYDREGKIMNPTFGAGVRFGQYGFDFGYTAGEQDHARANTMFFSISMDL